MKQRAMLIAVLFALFGTPLLVLVFGLASQLAPSVMLWIGR